MKIKKLNTNHTHKKLNKTQKGGSKTLYKKLVLGKLAVNARVSEIEMFEYYNKYVKYRMKYLKLYQEHRDALKALDSKIGNTSTLLKCFDNIVMPADILAGEPIDTNNPLLYTHYYINNDSLVKDLIEEHYKQQIYYYYYTKFDKKAVSLLKAIAVKNISSSSIKLEFIGNNNKYYLRECKIVDDMMLDKDNIIEILENITAAIKSNKSEYISEPKKLAEKKALEEAEKKAKEEDEARRAENALKPPGMPGMFKPPPPVALSPSSTPNIIPPSPSPAPSPLPSPAVIVYPELKADQNLVDLIKNLGKASSKKQLNKTIKQIS